MSGRRLSRETTDLLLIAALARGATQTDAAKLAKVSTRTVHRRLEAPRV